MSGWKKQYKRKYNKNLVLHHILPINPNPVLIFDGYCRWDGEGGGRGVQDAEYMYTHGWFMSMYGKNHYNTVKYNTVKPPIK